MAITLVAGLNDGALQAIANGGVPNYSYYWNSIKLTDSIVNLVLEIIY